MCASRPLRDVFLNDHTPRFPAPIVPRSLLLLPTRDAFNLQRYAIRRLRKRKVTEVCYLNEILVEATPRRSTEINIARLNFQVSDYLCFKDDFIRV